MRCKHCSKDIGNRTNKVYCSGACKVAMFRKTVTGSDKKTVTNPTDVTVSEKPLQKPRDDFEAMINDVSPEVRAKMVEVIRHLLENKDRMLTSSAEGEAIFWIGKYQLVLK